MLVAWTFTPRMLTLLFVDMLSIRVPRGRLVARDFG
jgi:hypothetical protein